MFDVIVIGAGPAGATFARLMAGRAKVLVIDRGQAKCCGGLIAPDAQAVLASFDIGIPKSVIADPQLFYVRSIDLESGLEQRYQRHYTNIKRKEFDEYMAGMLPPEVTVLHGALYVGHETRGDSVSVKVDRDGAIEEYSCRILVGADGAWSRVREQVWHDFRKLRKYLAIQGEYSSVEAINHYAVFFDRSITDFYCWLIPKDRTVLVGGAFRSGAGARASYEALLARVRDLYLLGEELSLDAHFLIRPRLGDLRIGAGKVFLIGEAAGFISPSSSEGLSYAYKSAMALSDAIRESPGNALRAYRKKTMGLRLNIVLKNLKSLGMYGFLLRNLAFRSGIGSLGKA